VFVGHPARFARVALAGFGVGSAAEVARIDIERRGRLAARSRKARQGALLAEIVLAVERRVGRADEVPFVVRVRPLDRPDSRRVVGRLDCGYRPIEW